jgi:hypothetical protein
LSENPNAIEILRNNIGKIYWDNLSTNENAIDILRDNYKNINWNRISINSNAIDLIKDFIESKKNLFPEDIFDNLHEEELYQDKISIKKNRKKFKNRINWRLLSTNKNAIPILNKLNKMDNNYIFLNENKKNFDEINVHGLFSTGWENLAMNPNTIDILKENNFESSFYADYDETLYFKEYLGWNLNLVDYLEDNIDLINWKYISINPEIFEIDYEKIKKRNNIFKEELIQKCFHPKRLVYYLEKYNYDIGEE